MEINHINYQFKLLYAIGIVFIVSGHISNYGGIHFLYDWFPLYTFHLGLFCFASGYFYKTQSSVYLYIWKKFKRLMIPLYGWNFIYGALTIILSYSAFTIGMSNEYSLIDKFFVMPLTDGHQFEYNLATWFVFPFFLVEVYNVLIRKICRNSEWLLFIIAMILGIGAISYANHLEHRAIGIPLLIIRVLGFLPFFYMGCIYKRKLEKKDTCRNAIYFLGIFSIMLILMIMRKHAFQGFTQSWAEYHSNPILVYIVGMLGIAFWLRVSRILTPILGKSKLVNLIADNTFSIMTHHFLGFMIVKTIIYSISVFVVLTPSFDVAAYHEDLWYYYQPYNIQQFSIVYLIVGITVPLVIAVSLEKSRLKISNMLERIRLNIG